MGTGSSESLKWVLRPQQLVWKLSDRAREYGQAKTLSPTAAVGKLGEDLAHRYLARLGLKVIARNYKPGPDSEVDIVARKDDSLIFVEVKTRTSDKDSAPDRAIDEEKKRHIFRAAKAFATRAGVDWGHLRFDIVAIVLNTPPTITHYEDAFYF